MVLSTEGNVCCYDGIYAFIGNSEMIVYYCIVYVSGEGEPHIRRGWKDAMV